MDDVINTAPSAPTEKEYTFEDVFDAVGGLGPYQIVLLFFLGLSGISTSVSFYIMIFAQPVTDHRCYRIKNELDNNIFVKLGSEVFFFSF